MTRGIGRISKLGTTASDFKPYHDRSRSRDVEPELRQFIAWDGEGANLNGEGRPQSYILFGCSDSDIQLLASDTHLHTFDILDYIISVGERRPSAFHVGFAFGYDANMILRSLHQTTLTKLHTTGKITLRRGDDRFHIHYLPKKWFSVTKFKPQWNRKTNPMAKTTVRIYDLFGFFAKSFIKAYEELVGPVPEIVMEGKRARGDFHTLGAEYVEKYWRAEIIMLRELAEELRKRLYGAGLRITQWHGPGALASFAMRKHGVDKFKADCPQPVKDAAKYGYAGGRFEIFHLGRKLGPIYSLDINSAYPFGISQLPDLTTGTWSHRTGPFSRVARFGIYRIRLRPNSARGLGMGFERQPSPLFHRDRMGNISYPWLTEGWYWSPEVRNLFKLDPAGYEIIEGWEYTGWNTGTEEGSAPTAPFVWVREMYEQRREWKAKGMGAQLALKLCMNSLYGKMAQRVGWNEEKREPPKWHQLEWAGWVTSLTRAMLWDVMSRIPYDALVAVETDGLYTTMHPRLLGISTSADLGRWEVAEYDEIMYVQSGMAWLRKDGEWACKRRGLDARTFALDDCATYLQRLGPLQQWLPYVGETTRFIGLGAALNGSAPLKVRHCVWQTAAREIRPGQDGKRVHIFRQCKACAEGLSAYDGMHDMCIRSLAYAPGNTWSKPHDIPWDGDVAAEWRERMMFDVHTESSEV